MSAPALKRGWCPGVLRPMESGDGLLARIRPRRGRFSRSEALLVADCAARYGNGAIDLTGRGNLQLRGVSATSLPGLTRALDAAGLLDESEAVEAARNIVISPASDCDPAALLDAAALAARVEPIIAEIAAEGSVASKFSLAIDDGGRFSLDAVQADIRLKAVLLRGEIKLRLSLGGDAAAARPLGVFALDDALLHVASLYRAAVRLFPGRRPRERDEIECWANDRPPIVDADGSTPSVGRAEASRRIGAGTIACLRPPFGRLDASQLAEAAQCLSTEGQATFRPTTERALLVAPVGSDERRELEAFAVRERFMTSDADPLHGIDACAGAPACLNATTDIRADARRLAAALPPGAWHGSIHVSGCAKGCASPAPSAVTLTAEAGSYRIGLKAKAGEGVAIGTLDQAIAYLAALTDAPPNRS